MGVPATPSDAVAPVALKVTGVYRVVADPTYWLRTMVDGKSGFLIAEGTNNVAAIDDFLTAQATFDTGWSQAATSLEFPLDRDTVTLATVPQISDSLQGLERASENVTVTSPVPDIVDAVVAGRSIVRALVPLLLAQLALLAVTVLALMAHAAVEQRRPEIALARLRGRSRDGGGGGVMGELPLTVLLGAPLGVALALGVGDLLRRAVMPPGVPFELRWPVAVAAVVAVLGSLLAVYLVSRPVLREPIGALLRRVPPQASRGLGVLDAVVVVVAALGVAAVLTGDVDGPTALLVPMLLALAVGLLGAAALRRLASRVAERALARGRLSAGLAALSLARRPALRNVLVGGHHDRRHLTRRTGGRGRRARAALPVARHPRGRHPSPGPLGRTDPARPPRRARTHRFRPAHREPARPDARGGAEHPAHRRRHHRHAHLGPRGLPNRVDARR